MYEFDHFQVEHISSSFGIQLFSYWVTQRQAAEQHALKLHAVAKAVWKSSEKAMAAVSRRGGLQVRPYP